MRIAVFLPALLFLAASGVQAAEIGEYVVRYDVQAGGQVREALAISFSQPLNESARNALTLGEVSDVQVLADGRPLQVSLSRENGDHRVSFITPAGTGRLEVSFTASDLVFRSEDVFQFFTELTPPPGVGALNIRVILPPGFAVYRNRFFPAGAALGTDGERIFLEWAFQGSQDPVSISVQFEPLFKGNELALPAIALVAALVVAGTFLHFRRKRRQDFLLTFFEDERKVVLALMTERVAYQNTLERKFSFSRAKMTRIVQKLGRQGLVRKEKAGRTNRLTWKGGLGTGPRKLPFWKKRAT